jgi:hypothetical protein
MMYIHNYFENHKMNNCLPLKRIFLHNELMHKASFLYLDLDYLMI